MSWPRRTGVRLDDISRTLSHGWHQRDTWRRRGGMAMRAAYAIFLASVIWGVVELVRGDPGGAAGHIVAGSAAALFCSVIGLMCARESRASWDETRRRAGDLAMHGEDEPLS